jgi:hypothetical protein
LPIYTVELPVACDGVLDYELWKMGGSVSFNDLGFNNAYFVWNPHYLSEGMWENYGLVSTEPVTLLSYAQETNPLTPCTDARTDPNHGPVGPIIAQSEHPSMIRAYPTHPRGEPDLTLPTGYQDCYDILSIQAGNGLVPCGQGSSSGALYLIIQPNLAVKP